jgi:hypothetical protein
VCQEQLRSRRVLLHGRAAFVNIMTFLLESLVVQPHAAPCLESTALDLSGWKPEIRTHRAWTCLIVVITSFCHTSSRFDPRIRYMHARIQPPIQVRYSSRVVNLSLSPPSSPRLTSRVPSFWSPISSLVRSPITFKCSTYLNPPQLLPSSSAKRVRWYRGQSLKILTTFLDHMLNFRAHGI